MFSKKQCDLARLMTQDETDDERINKEFSAIDTINREAATKEIDNLLKLHNMPFDKGIWLLQEDFSKISTKFDISPATLFCIYMELKNK